MVMGSLVLLCHVVVTQRQELHISSRASSSSSKQRMQAATMCRVVHPRNKLLVHAASSSSSQL